MVETRILLFWRPDSSVILVVKNIILRQRAAVDVSDGGFHGHSVLKAKFPVLPSVGHGRAGFRDWPGNQVCLGTEAVGLAVDAVHVLGDADAAAIHQELRQEVALRSCGGIKVSLTGGSWKQRKKDEAQIAVELQSRNKYRACRSISLHQGAKHP